MWSTNSRPQRAVKAALAAPDVYEMNGKMDAPETPEPPGTSEAPDPSETPAQSPGQSSKFRMAFVVFSALALLALLVTGYVFSGRLRQAEAGDVMLEPSACDLNQGPCQVVLPDGAELTAEISPRPIAVMRPLTVRLAWPDGKAKSVSLDLIGIDMEMGMNRNPLQEISPGQYLGQAALPICVTGPMRWRAEFVIANEQGRIIAPFIFSSGL
jgi:hypothetical protein